jgi:hypothetical protein
MLRYLRKLSYALLLCVVSAPVLGADVKQANYDFATMGQDIEAWRQQTGFVFRRHAGEPGKVKLGLGARGLTMETLEPAEPILELRKLPGNNAFKIEHATLKIVWGVKTYPKGADWTTGSNREAISISVLFGSDRPRGVKETLLGLPALPYFLSFLLCEKATDKIFKAKTYQDNGRYECVASPAAGTEITTVLDLDKKFAKAFPTVNSVPAVTGFAIESDTTDLDPGLGSAWIRSLEIAPRN